MKTIEEIKQYLSNKKPLLRHDVARSFEFELYTFLPYSELPDTYKAMLLNIGIKEEKWGEQIPSDNTEESILSDIKDEIDTLYAIIEAPKSACLCRVPRVLALMWVYGVEESKIKAIDRNIGEIYRQGNGNPKVVKRLINKIKDILS